MTDAELINAIEAQRALMIAVATGGPRIQEVNVEYTHRRIEIDEEFNVAVWKIRTLMVIRGLGADAGLAVTGPTGHQDAFTSLACIKG
jgi:hypothetical protein